MSHTCQPTRLTSGEPTRRKDHVARIASWPDVRVLEENEAYELDYLWIAIGRKTSLAILERSKLRLPIRSNLSIVAHGAYTSGALEHRTALSEARSSQTACRGAPVSIAVPGPVLPVELDAPPEVRNRRSRRVVTGTEPSNAVRVPRALNSKASETVGRCIE
jgi:hypothetical protein